MKQIPLSVTNKWKNYKHKFVALIDDIDYDLVKDRKWYFSDGYARTTLPKENGKKKHISMHRLILNVLDPKIKVDHKNHNGLDNTRENIRACSHQENLRNKSSWGSSNYLGVNVRNRIIKSRMYKSIEAGIRVDGKRMYLGSFISEEDAAKAYDEAAIKYFGEFANLNFKQAI